MRNEISEGSGSFDEWALENTSGTFELADIDHEEGAEVEEAEGAEAKEIAYATDEDASERKNEEDSDEEGIELGDLKGDTTPALFINVGKREKIPSPGGDESSVMIASPTARTPEEDFATELELNSDDEREASRTIYERTRLFTAVPVLERISSPTDSTSSSSPSNSGSTSSSNHAVASLKYRSDFSS